MKNMKLGFYLVIIPICLHCYNSPKHINSYFNALEEKIEDKRKLEKFKKAPREAVIIYSSNFSEEFEALNKDSLYAKIVNSFIDDIKNLYDYNTGVHTLIIAFQNHLNGKKNNIKKIANDVYLYNSKIKIEQDLEDDKNKRELSEIIRANNQEWFKGDTISLILPVRLNGNTKEGSTYYSIGYPLTLDYSLADDTLKLRGILLEKFYESSLKDKILDPLDLTFKIRITELSDTTYYILLRKYEVGDELNVSLHDYGRPIE